METTVATIEPWINHALCHDTLYAAYQPIVELSTGAVVAYESLARWRDPEMHPGVAFPAALADGRLGELDWACRRAAVEGALAAGLTRDHLLFINVEASTLGTPVPEWATPLLGRAESELRVVVELTERALLANPREVLRLVAWARERGWGVALDDVGADPESLTLLPFVEPDIIKLDLTLIQQRPGLEQGRVMSAVLAHAESTGVAVLGEGIETEQHLEQAEALGATLGQGWYFGRPGELDPRPPRYPFELVTSPSVTVTTPFALVADSPRVKIGRRDVLLGLSNHLESLGLGHDDVVLFGTFQTDERFTPAARRRYETLAERCALVGAFGVGMSDQPARGVRGASLEEGESLAEEWVVAVVGSHYAGALIAKDLGDDGPAGARRFAFVVTHDRPLVLNAARSLMARLVSCP